MDAVRESWTDERLDDFREETARRFDTLERRMDEGFDRVHAEIRDLRGEMDMKINALRAETKTEFGEVRTEIAALHRLILQVGGGMFVTMLVGFLGIATQL